MKVKSVDRRQVEAQKEAEKRVKTLEEKLVSADLVPLSAQCTWVPRSHENVPP